MTSERVPTADLKQFAASVLETVSVPTEDAALVADSLVQADLWGHQSHGVLRLPWYVARLRSGAMTVKTPPAPLIDSGALLLLDGQGGIGQVLTEGARREAVARAKTHGVSVVAIRDSNHFGTAMYYTRRAAAEGCVSILTTNASPAMAPWGGREKVLGTNPWSIAAPDGSGGVLALDIANTAVARGKIYLAHNRGEDIPQGWALGSDGSPTTDAAEAIHGLIAPMAGHKGYAIAFMMDVLSGALTGSQVGTGVHGPYEADQRSGCGHLMITIDVAALTPTAEYAAKVTSLADEVHATPLAKGAREIVVPGELEDRAERQNLLAGGVVLPTQTMQDLAELATTSGVALPQSVADSLTVSPTDDSATAEADTRASA